MMSLPLPSVSAAAAPPPTAEPQTPLAAAALPEFLQLLKELPLPGLRSELPPITLTEALVDDTDPVVDPSVMVPLLLNLLAIARAPAMLTDVADALPSSAMPLCALTVDATSISPDAPALAALEAGLDLAPVEASGLELLSARAAETAVPRAAHAPAATAPEMTLPPGNPRWAEDFGERVMWVVHRGIGTAEIKLNPLELGRVNIRLDIEGDQARVQFSATQVQAVAALEQTLPRLRELFAQEGLNLAQVQVSAQGGQDHARQTPSPLPSVVTADSGETVTDVSASDLPLRRRQGLLDDYA